MSRILRRSLKAWTLIWCLLGTNGFVNVRPPTIKMKEKREQVYVEGEQIHLSCEATGIPEPEVSWYFAFDGVKVPEDSDTHNQNGILKFLPFSKRHAGEYQCNATNDHGTALSNIVMLRYAYFDVNLAENEITLKVNEGESCEIKCRLDREANGFPPLKYDWIHTPDNGNSQEEITLDGRVAIDGDGNLFISNVKKSDESIYYYCRISNDRVGKTKYGSPTKLKVISGSSVPLLAPQVHYPKLLKTRSVHMATEGESVELYCLFAGRDISIDWYKNDLRITEELPPNIILRNGNSLLALEKVKNTADFNGLYRCVGRNTKGKKEQMYTVKVESRPTIVWETTTVKDMNLTEGKRVEFKCQAKGEPSPVIIWLVNGKPSVSEDRRKISGESYEMTGLRRNDSHVVTCKAQNEVGAEYISGYVNVQPSSGSEDTATPVETKWRTECQCQGKVLKNLPSCGSFRNDCPMFPGWYNYQIRSEAMKNPNRCRRDLSDWFDYTIILEATERKNPSSCRCSPGDVTLSLAAAKITNSSGYLHGMTCSIIVYLCILALGAGW